jgi:hypothetical protein
MERLVNWIWQKAVLHEPFTMQEESEIISLDAFLRCAGSRLEVSIGYTLLLCQNSNNCAIFLY